MEPDRVIRILQDHGADLVAHGVASISLFGSTARGSARSDSDVDVLVTFEAPPGLREFMGLKFALEEWLGSTVDLIDRAAVRDRWLPEVERDAIVVA